MVREIERALFRARREWAHFSSGGPHQLLLMTPIAEREFMQELQADRLYQLPLRGDVPRFNGAEIIRVIDLGDDAWRIYSASIGGRG